MSTRQEQINSNIQHELSNIFNTELEFPLDCLVTVSRVVVSDDLRWAQVWVSILPITSRSKVRNVINKKKGLLQQLLNRRLKMKPIPRLKFFTDFTEEYAQGVEGVIDQAINEI